MKLIFTGHNDRYAIEQDLLAFFPNVRPVYDPEAEEDSCALPTPPRPPASAIRDGRAAVFPACASTPR